MAIASRMLTASDIQAFVHTMLFIPFILFGVAGLTAVVKLRA